MVSQIQKLNNLWIFPYWWILFWWCFCVNNKFLINYVYDKILYYNRWIDSAISIWFIGSLMMVKVYPFSRATVCVWVFMNSKHDDVGVGYSSVNEMNF